MLSTKNNKNTIGKISESGKLSPASSASTLKEPSDKGKAALERRHAYDTISTNSDPENSSIIPSDTGKLLDLGGGGGKHRKKSSSPSKHKMDGSGLMAIKENGDHLGRASIKNLLNGNDPSVIAASFKQSLSSLKSGTKAGENPLKSRMHKSKKKNVVMVDCASQTDFPWTEEDEKREKKRRKRERAEMRKQMYLMKAEASGEPVPVVTKTPVVASKNKNNFQSKQGSSNRGFSDREETTGLRAVGRFFATWCTCIYICSDGGTWYTRSLRPSFPL